MGLSPRVRGNQLSTPTPADQGRSIPARAGEPSQPSRTAADVTVYPRACGGTDVFSSAGAGAVGLSPRVRGNPSWTWPSRFAQRSIPARAGEPKPNIRAAVAEAVYPRACGGTETPSRTLLPFQGLSPRVRGNRCSVMPARARWGSIPARAGEPWPCGSAPCGGKVYPRACGGTA